MRDAADSDAGCGAPAEAAGLGGQQGRGLAAAQIHRWQLSPQTNAQQQAAAAAAADPPAGAGARLALLHLPHGPLAGALQLRRVCRLLGARVGAEGQREARHQVLRGGLVRAAGTDHKFLRRCHGRAVPAAAGWRRRRRRQWAERVRAAHGEGARIGIVAAKLLSCERPGHRLPAGVSAAQLLASLCKLLADLPSSDRNRLYHSFNRALSGPHAARSSARAVPRGLLLASCRSAAMRCIGSTWRRWTPCMPPRPRRQATCPTSGSRPAPCLGSDWSASHCTLLAKLASLHGVGACNTHLRPAAAGRGQGLRRVRLPRSLPPPPLVRRWQQHFVVSVAQRWVVAAQAGLWCLVDGHRQRLQGQGGKRLGWAPAAARSIEPHRCRPRSVATPSPAAQVLVEESTLAWAWNSRPSLSSSWRRSAATLSTLPCSRATPLLCSTTGALWAGTQRAPRAQPPP